MLRPIAIDLSLLKRTPYGRRLARPGIAILPLPFHKKVTRQSKKSQDESFIVASSMCDALKLHATFDK